MLDVYDGCHRRRRRQGVPSLQENSRLKRNLSYGKTGGVSRVFSAQARPYGRHAAAVANEAALHGFTHLKTNAAGGVP